MTNERDNYPPSFLDLPVPKKRRKKSSFADIKGLEEKIPPGFHQTSFFGDSDSSPAADVMPLLPDSGKEDEVTIENCRLASDPLFTEKTVRRKKIAEWSVTVMLLPDLWHTEEGTVELHALGNAEKANKLGLKAGDTVDVTGVRWSQRVQFGDTQSGREETMKHMNVTNITIIRKAPRQA